MKIDVSAKTAEVARSYIGREAAKTVEQLAAGPEAGHNIPDLCARLGVLSRADFELALTISNSAEATPPKLPVSEAIKPNPTAKSRVAKR